LTRSARRAGIGVANTVTNTTSNSGTTNAGQRRIVERLAPPEGRTILDRPNVSAVPKPAPDQRQAQAMRDDQAKLISAIGADRHVEGELA
jgi:hypothetical protein